ncbi:MAG: hypothetical protein IPJ88_12265 [Myxococcales bacterium]|nr:MAG: hypothetical protein IPJ88_12265 [Myxococcales bacterium]
MIIATMIMACGRIGFDHLPNPSDPGNSLNDSASSSSNGNGTGAPARVCTSSDCWWDDDYPDRVELFVSGGDTSSADGQPVWITSDDLPSDAAVDEDSLRVLCWDTNAGAYVEVAHAVYDWVNDDYDSLGDTNEVFDGNDELIFLMVPNSDGTTECHIYYGSNDTPAAYPVVELQTEGSGFDDVIVDGMPGSASSISRIDNGTTVYQIMLSDSLPFWNDAANYTYPSSSVGPRINNLTLPDGTEVYPTVVDAAAGPDPLIHTIRLGPNRHDGTFNVGPGASNRFFQPHLVNGDAHSQVRIFSSPVASVVVIDSEFYCAQGTGCDPVDRGDVRLIGYLFDRGDSNEVLMRWRIRASTSTTIDPHDQLDGYASFSYLAYLIEDYTENIHAVDIDTVRFGDSGGPVNSRTMIGQAGSDSRVCTSDARWGLMTDTDGGPFSGTLSVLLEDSPQLVQGGMSQSPSWNGCWFDDGTFIFEPNGYQSEWHFTSDEFRTWGAAGDTVAYNYWIYAYPHPGAGNDYDPANTAALWVASFTTTSQHQSKP